MDYKTICVFVTDIVVDQPAIAAATAFARREGAHLDVHCLGIDPTRYDAIGMGGTMVMLDSGFADAQLQADTLIAAVKPMIPDDLVGFSIQPVVSQHLGLNEVLARLARTCDLVISAKPYGPGHSTLAVAVVEATLFGTGAPVLIIPEGSPDTGHAPERIIVAWNESDQAFAAIRAAMPLLKAAAHVDIVMIEPPSHSPERSDPGGAICTMLSRHGVHAEVSILARTLPRVSDTLLRFARDKGAEAIVMGAYGHSRLREAILGGATRDMMEQTTLPLLMAH